MDFFELPEGEQIESLGRSAQVILSEYGLIGCEINCINYEFNATFAVVTDNGDKYALRININSTRTTDNMLAEVQWVNFLTRVPGINVARPIANNADSFITQQGHSDSGRTLHAVLFTWLEGEEIGDEPTNQQLSVVGASMARLHQSSHSFALTGSAVLPTFNDWLWGTDDFLLSDKSLLSQSEHIAIRSAIEIITTDTHALYASTPIQIIHGDLHGWNLMWHEGELSIFDFDDCGFGIPAQDLAIALYYLDTPEQEAALLQGYESISQLPTYSKGQMSSLLLQRRLLLLNYLYETKNVEHKAMRPAYREKTMDRVARFLTDVRG